ncbi:N-acetylneuraminate synthase [Colwellia sp. TT2012]|uniref:N-acetylneuraminate synthase n=1 Tax=Colwellia sp. TT2012 TaxID=1720342 RepID=UPI00070D7239|nr:N-acetylneuraminate synthase [Colwellia sp. TT2012]
MNNTRTLIIAEAGVNHNGDIELAKKLIDVAATAGADIVKFQTFKAKNLVTATAEQCEYQINNTGKKESQLTMLSRLELSYEAHHKLLAQCDALNIEFLSTAFDSESLAFLVNELGLKRLKIPSGELTNAPLVLEHAQTGCDLIVSTGMASLAEVEATLGVIAFGYTASNEAAPSIEAFQKAYFSESGQKALQEKVTLLHCTSEYPAPMVDINLKAMDTMTLAFNLPVGYSDHSAGITVPVAAVARGAVIIEKHFTLDNTMEGPDHKASLEPKELTDMVNAIRNVEQALGDGVKAPRPSEVKNKALSRKSLVAARPIRAGEKLTKDNIEIKRPGIGLSPYLFWTLLEQVARKDYQTGDVLID